MKGLRSGDSMEGEGESGALGEVERVQDHISRERVGDSKFDILLYGRLIFS